ncbi:hypothetical protein CLV30_1357 [Haloactinopolyspora alba]|uniref:Uncharacterized protein n=1 Tax=Haloactinopolyspora alba TaxID=648780 RepID=A0A2P8D2F7_9ACTN|nr:hypothetical protein [Haloactinopolyspora alba]PSK91405.1 hypothetical protein CLV30_1357 [Haloactinopolyspora alba]
MVHSSRTIDPTDTQDDRVAALSLTAAYTYAYLPTVLDDEGRAKDQPAVFNGHLWPLRADAHPTAAMADDLAELESAGLLCRYVVEGHEYVHDPEWKRRQKIDRPERSALPRCPVHHSPLDDFAASLGRVPGQVGTALGDAASRFDAARVGDAVSRLVETATFPVDPGKAADYGQRIRDVFSGGEAGAGAERRSDTSGAGDDAGTDEEDIRVERAAEPASEPASGTEAQPDAGGERTDERSGSPDPGVWSDVSDDPTRN